MKRVIKTETYAIWKTDAGFVSTDANTRPSKYDQPNVFATTQEATDYISEVAALKAKILAAADQRRLAKSTELS